LLTLKSLWELETKTSPVEYKVISQQQKKSIPWAKQTGLLSKN